MILLWMKKKLPRRINFNLKIFTVSRYCIAAFLLPPCPPKGTLKGGKIQISTRFLIPLQGGRGAKFLQGVGGHLET